MHFNVCCVYVSVCTDNDVFLEYFLKSCNISSLQGQGVERDIPKAVYFLKKAMDQVFFSKSLIHYLICHQEGAVFLL